MHDEVNQVVIVGGGTAGWLTAAVLASSFQADGTRKVTVLESPDISPVGVGEGTWPSMRDTLHRIGVGETEFIRACDATMKQGSLFINWCRGDDADTYMHPFTLPMGFLDADLVGGWLESPERPYAEQVSFQPRLCAAGYAPKQFATPEYAAVANYAYHLDAGKFGTFLREHCVNRLGVRHLADHMLSVNADENGDIASVRTRENGDLEGDLFVDCTGARALLLGGHFGVERVGVRDVLFNDRAMAVQVPYGRPDAPIACQTLSTAQQNGWIWDIGLSARRGIGFVYSSAHTSDDQAETTLLDYLRATGVPDGAPEHAPRRIAFDPGYRRESWYRNCLAIGLSAGFVEPLEASSLALVELGATALADQFPATRADMDRVARRFNESFSYRWQRVVDFLKLHYAVSSREDSEYWRDHRGKASMPDSLREMLDSWHFRPPSRYDFTRVDEIFPSASYHYVLYGMGFKPDHHRGGGADEVVKARNFFRQAADMGQRMSVALPTHRALIEHVTTRGLPKT